MSRAMSEQAEALKASHAESVSALQAELDEARARSDGVAAELRDVREAQDAQQVTVSELRAQLSEVQETGAAAEGAAMAAAAKLSQALSEQKSALEASHAEAAHALQEEAASARAASESTTEKMKEVVARYKTLREQARR